ncbi:hypothetical protein FRACYDRAFT_231912 [Fragilariopsis cylindrus CCMP1102]|uniref:Uncharacterized protein n=1 Tax=Fragilariopsis cylindrus CCMP1102 TaxID=635003 RepID=A0A1E7FUD6_9STRA|nr:hypothetical protein FRACYDRAFT_231912 [Fragilariopsis cylindrus CCMP1102]|eukprot:OEU21766.1 hypothetical protein FRACYDRAFT_231912 [Fragilariopsis cylindrus CCMP1102]
MNVSAVRGREIKSQRARELDELRSRGRTKCLREKLNDFSSPLQTAEEARQFLLACRDQSKREWAMNDDGSWATAANGEGRPALTSNSVDYNSFLMTQRKRQKELKLRRKEAEQLLHGFRGSYGESFGTWSPRKNKNGRSSFGYSTTSDSLMDPDHSSSRRQSSMPRLENPNYWDDDEEGRDDNDQFGERVPPSPLGSHRKDFLYDSRHYDGTEYPRTSQEWIVANGVSLANTRLVMMTPTLLNFCREVYQMPGVAETCQMDQIKAHFFGSHAEWNKYSVVPRGLGFMRYLDMPHDRDKLEGFGHLL